MARLPSEHPFSLRALLHQAAKPLSQRGGAAWEEGAGGDRVRRVPTCAASRGAGPVGRGPVPQLLRRLPCLASSSQGLGAACWSAMWPQILLGPWAVLGVIKGNSGISNFLRSTASSFLKRLVIPLLTTKIGTICFYNRVVTDGRFIKQRPCCDSFWKVTCQET